MLSGGYGGALAVSQGLRYQGKLKESTLDNEVGYRISRAYGSHGRVDVKLDESTFEDNFAWRDGGALFASGGKTAAVNSILHVDVDNSLFKDNVAFQGTGGGIRFTKGDDNGDYKCQDESVTCDMKRIGMEIGETEFSLNWAGEALIDNDVVGDTEMTDTVWREDVDKFGETCDGQCNDGVFLEGTNTFNLCTITAKSLTMCPTG